MPTGLNSTGQTYGTRQGGVGVHHSYPVQFNTPGIGSAILVDVIKADPNNPVQVEVSAQVITAFNAATTNVLTIGTTTAANEWLSASGNPLVVGYSPASNAVAKFRLIADTNVYVKFTQSGGAATTGAAVIFVKEFDENAIPIV